MSNDVSVTIDVANQSITSSDTNIITVPTQNFEIVTFDNKPCIRATNDSYATFTISPTIKSLSCDVFLQAVSGFTLLIEFDTVSNTKYSLVYYPHGSWWNPDSAVFDSNDVLVGIWVTVTYSSTNKTITFDNGTTQLTRVIDSSIADLSIGNFGSRYNIYLTNLGAETSSRYVNKPGLAEVWGNIKNYITAQLLSFIPRSGGSVITGSSLGKTDDTGSLQVCGGSNGAGGASILLNGKNRGVLNGYVELTADDGTDSTEVQILPDGTMTKIKGASTKNFAMQEDTVPLAGTSALSGSIIPDTDNSYDLGSSAYGFRNLYTHNICTTGLSPYDQSTTITFSSQDYFGVVFRPTLSNNGKILLGASGARWKEIWCTQSSINSSSDRRLKQQIDSIDDKLLDAWKNVEPTQYKFNDAVETKGKSARYHIGYVSQDIQSALDKGGVNASDYGFFLYDAWDEQEEISHEEEYTEESQTKDGTTETVTKTRKVIDTPYRAKGDSYGLRYTECLVVECAYLRRCIARLTARIEELEKGIITND